MRDPFGSLPDRARDALRECDVPEWLDPMLATLTDEPFSNPEWVYERKLDGVRLLAFRSGGDRVRLMTRNRKKRNSAYPEKVGTGFDDETLDTLSGELRSRERDGPPFDRGDLPDDGIHWAIPNLVCQVGFTEWTDAGRLRHPRYEGLRHDKNPRDVVRERPA